MAATNPFRVSDLIAKYGWKIMPYLSNLGVRSLAEAQVLFVDSGHTNALDADDTEHGHSLEKPLATIDYAVGLQTASEGGIILVAPGHAETKAASGSLVTADINGISIIGLGEGLLRPTLTLSTDTGAIAFTVSAANVTLVNIRVLVSIDALVSAIVVTGTDCKLIDIEVQDNANTTEVAIAVLTAATADRLHIERFKHNGFVDGDACTESLSLIGVDRAVIKDCWFRGIFSTAAVNMVTTACTGILIENCKFENGVEALVSDIVDTQGSSVWSAINCWDVVDSTIFNGGSAEAVKSADVGSIANIQQLFMGTNLNSIPGSAMPIAIWYVDANISASGDGKTPATAFKTIQEAITACSNSVDDWILVFDYSGGGATITINKAFVHLIGNANPAMPYPRIKPASAVPGITITSAGDRVEIANLVIGGGDQTVAAISFAGSSAGAYGVYIHDCVLGRDSDAPGLYGVYVPSGDAAPYLRVENNRFIGAGGSGIVAAGSAVRIAGNATRCVIKGNHILDIGKTATPAIWLDGGVTEPTIIDNQIKVDTDTGTGSAITLGASVDDGWVCDNAACDVKTDMSNNPFLDSGSTNGWARNYNGASITQPA